MQDLETKEKQNLPEPVDILSGKYRFHWTTIDKLPKIMQRGLYSERLAKRIGDSDYRKTRPHSNPKLVSLTSDASDIQSSNVFTAVGLCVLETTTSTFSRLDANFRVAPRQFVGILIVDKIPSWGFALNAPDFPEDLYDLEKSKSYVDRKIIEIQELLKTSETRARSIPIYGISGNLYWPKRITHEEIVRMLAERQK